MSTEENRRLCLTEGSWAGFLRSGPAGDGPWEFKDTEHCEDPDTAARVICSRQWTDGTHDVLVISATAAHQYRITVGTEEVTDA